MKKLVNVVMLSTEKASPIILDVTRTNPKLFSNYNNTQSLRKYYRFQHLYLVSDDEIKEGDWMFNTHHNMISKGPGGGNHYDKKIIATTDQSLLYTREKDKDFRGAEYERKISLPQIPESFVKAYVEAQGNIKEVLVEYTSSEEEANKVGLSLNAGHRWNLKLRPNNTVIIHQAKTYTREEVIDKVLSYFDDFIESWRKEGAIDPIKSYKWFEDNL
jgi:hypothetical protein